MTARRSRCRRRRQGSEIPGGAVICKRVLLVAGGIVSAEATKGQCKQAKPAIALWKPSAPLLLGLFAVGLCRALVNDIEH